MPEEAGRLLSQMENGLTKITFLMGEVSETVEAQAGDTVMNVAVQHGISGIIGECGGALMCATCHVYLDSETEALFDKRSATEDEMLEIALAEVTEYSRLGCQLIIKEGMPDFSVRVPDTQI